MTGELSHQDALIRIGASTAEAIAQVLEMFAPGEVVRGEVSVIDAAGSAFGSIEPQTVAAGVSYVDGITGANVFLVPPATARLLVERMGVPPESDTGDPLTELELSAVSEASNQMMAAAAAAIGMVLGQEVEISVPTTRELAGTTEAEELFGSAPYVSATSFTVAGSPCRLVQLVPSTFILRVVQALGSVEEGANADVRSDATNPARAGTEVDLADALSTVRLRVWAEIGRTRLPLGETLSLDLGAVVGLDHANDAPIELYVNGVRFATGELMTDDEGRWSVRIAELDRSAPHTAAVAAMAAAPC